MIYGLNLLVAFICLFNKGHPNKIDEVHLELEKTKKECIHIENKVHHLEKKLALLQIQAVRSLLVQKQKENHVPEFHDERTVLAEIMHDVPACASEAQAVLDEILCYITDTAQ